MIIALRDVGIGLVAGIALLIIGINAIGIMAAVAVPGSLIADGNIQAKIIVWEIVMVQVVGIGIAAAIISYLAVRFLSRSWLKTAITICIVVLGFTVVPQYVKNPGSFFGNAWWSHAHEIVVVAFVMLFSFLGSHKDA